MIEHLNKAVEMVIKNIYTRTVHKNRTAVDQNVRHVPMRGLMTARRYCSFRRDIRSVATAELLPRRNFISRTGIALWELHFYAAAAVQFRAASVTRRIFAAHCCRAATRYMFLNVVYETIDREKKRRERRKRENIREIAARPGSPVERNKTATTEHSFVNCAWNSHPRP